LEKVELYASKVAVAVGVTASSFLQALKNKKQLMINVHFMAIRLK
jgi:hypothetical protein